MQRIFEVQTEAVYDGQPKLDETILTQATSAKEALLKIERRVTKLWNNVHVIGVRLVGNLS